MRIFEGRTIGLPFLFFDFNRRLSCLSREAEVWKKWPGSLETLIANGVDFQDHAKSPITIDLDSLDFVAPTSQELLEINDLQL